MRNTFITGAFILAAGITAEAQDMSKDTLDLEEVKVQGSRLPVKFSESMRNISLLPSAELKEMPAVTVQDILSYVGSVDIRQRGASGVQADVSMRGGTFDQVLILINGVKFSDPQTGHHALNLTINPSDIERIEVLRGAASRIFGQNAFGGAINIVTKATTSNSIDADANYGSYNSRILRFSATNTAEDQKWGSRVSISSNSSDGYENNRDFSINQALLEGRYQLGQNGQLKVLAGHQSKNFGAQNFYTPPAWNFKEYEETAASFATLSGRFTRLKNLQFNINYRQHEDEFRLNREEVVTGVNRHTTKVLSADFNLSHESKLGLSSLGAEYRIEVIESSSLGNRSRQIASTYVEHQFKKYHGILATVGTNVSFIEGFGVTAFPGLDLGYELFNGFNLYTTFGRSYRIPTFTDLYYTDGGPSSLGNPDLDPESAWTYEGGIKWTRSRLNIQVDYFSRQASNLIDWQKTDPLEPWRAVNTRGIATQGFEFNAFYRPKLNWLSLVRLGYTLVDVSSIETPRISRYVYDYLAQQLNAGVQFKLTKYISSGVYYRYIERVSYVPAHIIDARVGVHFKAFECYTQIENITNTVYNTSLYVTMPSSWIRFGVNLHL